MKKIIAMLTVAALFGSCSTSTGISGSGSGQKKITPEMNMKILKMDKEEYDALKDGLYAEMETSMGDMTIELYEKDAPLTVANFVGLAEGTKENSAKPLGTPYYDGIIFHRVIKDFMIQGGDPDGKGTGGPGYNFSDEFFSDKKHDKKGVLSMANAGPNTNGSQFFITEVPTPWLNGRHTIFGQVIKGEAVIDSIVNVKKGPQDKPVDDIVINHVKIVRKGADYANYDGGKAFAKAEAENAAKLEAIEQKENAEKAKEIQRQKDLTAKASKTASGLMYYIEEEGTGETPLNGDMLNVHYTLRLNDGEKLDSSYDRNEPLRVQAGITQLIPGWMEALTMFKKGSKVFLIIPPDLGYGAQGAGGVIPPNATLYFDMDILND